VTTKRDFTLSEYRDAVDTAVSDGGLSAAPRVVLVIMAYKFMNAQRMEAWPSITTLTKWTAMRRQTVVNALRVLVVQGWLRVKVKGGGSRSTRYAPAIPKQYASDTSDRHELTDDAVDTRRAVSAAGNSSLPETTDGIPYGNSGPATDTRTGEQVERVNTGAASPAAARSRSLAAPPVGIRSEDLATGIVGVVAGELFRHPQNEQAVVLPLIVDRNERRLSFKVDSPLCKAIEVAYRTAMNQPGVALRVGDRVEIKAIGDTYAVTYTAAPDR
jgi:hypothetical protein